MNWVQKRENMKIPCHTGLGSHLPAFNRCFAGAHIVARPEMPVLRPEHPCKPQTSIPLLSSKKRSHFRFCTYLLPPDCIHSFFIRQNSLGQKQTTIPFLSCQKNISNFSAPNTACPFWRERKSCSRYILFFRRQKHSFQRCKRCPAI